MTDAEFMSLARAANLRPSRDVDGTAHVVGKRGDIYVHGPSRLAWCLFGDGATGQLKASMIRRFPSLLTVEQEGDEEATFTFAPEHLARVAWLCECRFRRVLSDARRAALAAGMAAVRARRATERERPLDKKAPLAVFPTSTGGASGLATLGIPAVEATVPSRDPEAGA